MRTVGQGSAPLVYRTAGGVLVERTTEILDHDTAIAPYVEALDTRPGAVFTSNYEVPGRYTRWSRALVDPPLSLEGQGQEFRLRALSQRGRVLLAIVRPALIHLPQLADMAAGPDEVRGTVAVSSARFAEEDRSRQPSLFSVVRALLEYLRSDQDAFLGLHGAFGYDLVHQFEPIPLHLERAPDQRDLVLYLPDELVVVDHAREVALRHRYDFSLGDLTTAGIPRSPVVLPSRPPRVAKAGRDHAPGAFAEVVRVAKESFRRGDLFEVVPGQTFTEPCDQRPSRLFLRLLATNPAPFGALLSLGQGEHLVSGSPEMYVRVEGRRVESCPISGTIARGTDVLGDADQILELLNSEKDAAELTMCTDVDRNDKSRICEPGSVRVIGRRQVELYSKVIHTVDHVEGILRPGYDAVDAFLTHMWAVTVTGAPKLWAMRFLEKHERTPRRWYGGAHGYLTCGGEMNTGLLLRTIRLADGVAEVRAGATLLIDSDPDAEERETELKAAAFLELLRSPEVRDPSPTDGALPLPVTACGPHVVLVDHEDSFVHTLANYLRQAGAAVRTVRAPFAEGEFAALLQQEKPSLVVLSPGPGQPRDFGMHETIAAATEQGVALFGVCLGLQGMVEYWGGDLDLLSYPAHGRASCVRVVEGGRLFTGLPATFTAGRYHSLIARRDTLPAGLMVTAETEDGLVMAVEHRDLPVAGVQFHPESLMTAKHDLGLELIRSVVERLAAASTAADC